MSDRNYDFVESAIDELRLADRRIEQLEDALDAANAKAAEWIPVSERLPDASVQHGYCLVSDGENVGTANYTADKFGGGRFWLIESRDEWEPTHWMPLPEPPHRGTRAG